MVHRVENRGYAPRSPLGGSRTLVPPGASNPGSFFRTPGHNSAVTRVGDIHGGLFSFRVGGIENTQLSGLLDNTLARLYDNPKGLLDFQLPNPITKRMETAISAHNVSPRHESRDRVSTFCRTPAPAGARRSAIPVRTAEMVPPGVSTPSFFYPTPGHNSPLPRVGDIHGGLVRSRVGGIKNTQLSGLLDNTLARLFDGKKRTNVSNQTPKASKLLTTRIDSDAADFNNVRRHLNMANEGNCFRHDIPAARVLPREDVATKMQALSIGQAPQVRIPPPIPPRAEKCVSQANGEYSSTQVVTVTSIAAARSLLAKCEPGSSPPVVKLVDCPKARARFKKFYAEFRAKESKNPADALKFAVQALKTIPSSARWRVCVSIGEALKRANDFAGARKWLKAASRVEPLAAQAWLERAKLEEECGKADAAHQVLSEGITLCWPNEILMRQYLRAQETRGDLGPARAALARLQRLPVEGAWRGMLEGALLEARAGNVKAARRIFKYLFTHVAWYGPIYLEACRFEESRDEIGRALTIVEWGLERVPRYGPLWFAALRLQARRALVKSRTAGIGLSPDCKTRERVASVVRATISRAVEQVAPELWWKLHVLHAQILQSVADFKGARRAFCFAALRCPKHLRWKVWLEGARGEALSGTTREVPRNLLNRAMGECPAKSRHVILLDAARHEQLVDNYAGAVDLLCRAKIESPKEWRLRLETALLWIRSGRTESALSEVRSALEQHPGTGRLWALYIQIQRNVSDSAGLEAARTAIQHVPKSGEVWCEVARLFLTPTARCFSLTTARRCLKFAIMFTPQYGDSFLELVRLDMLLMGPPLSENIAGQDRVQGLRANDAFAKRLNECINASPNYGSLWLLFKSGSDTSIAEILGAAQKAIASEIRQHRALYQRALLRNWAATGVERTGGDEVMSPAVKRWNESNINGLRFMYPGLEDLSTKSRFHALFGSDVIA